MLWLVLGLGLGPETGMNVCVRHNKEKTVYGRPKLLMIKWLGLSVTVRVRVRVRG